MKNYQILYQYLKQTCQAQLNHDHRQADRILSNITLQFANPDPKSQTKFQEEIRSFCDLVVSELKDNSGWYFLDDNLPIFIKAWQDHQLMAKL